MILMCAVITAFAVAATMAQFALDGGGAAAYDDYDEANASREKPRSAVQDQWGRVLDPTYVVFCRRRSPPPVA